ncbi:EamA/RhaT family transporter [Aureibaculum marinum]|uniref:EamA/RhaT family transporter n=1 Tax=Aureibaculum marinum TaxID=2487930 RepID=A0A3N4NSA1_9FLAO|nr:DMT family transporter [Aureibaculum marinum]RPD97527.1 EamA/RhaT family transporter [Aureibaculum marinum]
MNSRNFALLLAFLAALIYGVSFTVAKDVMPIYVKPYAFIILRVLGAAILFWVISFFAKKEKIDKNDYIRIILVACFGAAFNMLTFFKGLSLTSPISASVIMLTVPIVVLLLSTLILKEKINLIKVFGIAIGLLGAFILIVYGQSINKGENPLLGNFLVFVNATLYSFYLIMVKRLTDKYHPFTFVKWIYTIGLIVVIPFGFSELQEVQWQLMPTDVLLKAGFIVVFTTFFTYLFNLFALTKLKPTTLSIFVYLQPVIATVYALITESDSLSIVKILATILIFIGVYMVTNVNRPKQIT